MASFLQSGWVPDYILKPGAKLVNVDYAPRCPVVVVINSRSGGKIGTSLIKTYRELLNEMQVYDLSEEDPSKVLQRLYANLERLRTYGDMLAIHICRTLKLIVAGGDGTANWLLGILSDLKLAHPPPVAIVPLGTRNSIPFSLGWGKKNYCAEQEAVKSFLGLLNHAREIKIDSWHIVLRMGCPMEGPCDPFSPLELPHSLHRFHRMSSHESLNVEGYHTFRGGFWSYFSMGIDAEMCYQFHFERKRNPEKLKGKSIDQGTYAKPGLKQAWLTSPLARPSSRNISQLAIVKIARRYGQWEEVQIPSSIQSIVCLNLPSFSGGLNPWGVPGTKKAKERDFTPPFVDDALIEVVGFRDAWQGLLPLSTSGHCTRLAQAHRIRFEFHKGAAEYTFMMVDGEPWKQPLPTQDGTVVIEICHFGKITVLANEPCRSISVCDPSCPDLGQKDERDDEEDELDEERAKFGAADMFKIPDEIDIAHLS